MTARRVLVTGANGFLGANLVAALAGERAEVHAVLGPSGLLRGLAGVVPSCTIHPLPAAEPAAWRDLFEQATPDVVFSLAAGGVRRRARSETAGAEPAEPRSSLVTATVLTTALLLDQVERQGHARLVHVGSSLEYGPSSRPHAETDGPRPVTRFGAATAAASVLCAEFARSTNLPVVVLRSFSIYGPWEPRTRLIPTAIRAALTATPLPLTVPGLRRDFVYVEDVVEACLRAAEIEPARADGIVLNVGTGRQWANEEVVRAVEEATGRPIRVHVGGYPQHDCDTACWSADMARTADVLGWQPSRTLPEGLRATVAWARRHPEWLVPPPVAEEPL